MPERVHSQWKTCATSGGLSPFCFVDASDGYWAMGGSSRDCHISCQIQLGTAAKGLRVDLRRPLVEWTDGKDSG